MQKIIFICYGGGHAAMLLPVIKQVIRSSKFIVTVIGLTTAFEFFKVNKIECIGYNDLKDELDDEAINYGKKLVSTVSLNGQVGLSETIAYLGINYRELVREHGGEKAASLYKMHGRQAFLPINVFKRFFEKNEPNILISTNSPRSERAAFLAAKKMNIFSICIVDKYALQEVQWIGQAGYATRLCVLNEEVKKLFINCGRAEDEVCVTGNPAFERLQLQETRVAGLEFRRIKHWDDGSLNILWASQIEPKRHPFTGVIGDPNLPRSIEKCLRSFVAKHEKYRLIVRYHPSENIDFQQGQPNVEFSPLSEDLSVLLNAVDIVVVMTSNVGLEAKLAGCEVISVENSIFADDCPYGQMGVSTPVNSLPELEAAIFKLKREGGSERHVEFHSDEDLPTNKIVKIINYLAFNPSKSKENHESNT